MSCFVYFLQDEQCVFTGTLSVDLNELCNSISSQLNRGIKRVMQTLISLHTRCWQWGGGWSRKPWEWMHLQKQVAVMCVPRRTWTCGDICDTAILAKHKPFPPDKYRPQADLFSHKPKSSGSLKLLFFCLFSTLVKKRKKKHQGHYERYFLSKIPIQCLWDVFFFPANFLCLVPVNVFCSRSCMHARLCSYYRWSLQRPR